MGGKKTSFSSAFSFFKRKPRRVDDESYYGNYNDVPNTRRAFSSDEDSRGPWRVADPRVDTKTSDFIANFYATRVTEPDHIYQHAPNA
ncbi:hypothetical protein M5689_008617 [Euphorbia peplus]|nr:hypothetical protein M5689_008617 [Euphorbia peplus]